MFMSEVDDFIKDLDDQRSEVAKALRSLVKDNFKELKEIYSWKMPVYEFNGKKVVYIQKGKEGINLGFNNGSNINESKNLFQGGGKQMRHLAIKNLNEIDKKYIVDLIKQAIQNEK